MSVCVDYYYFVLVLLSTQTDRVDINLREQYQNKIIIIYTDQHSTYQLEGTVPKQNNNNPHRLTY
jgi:hypothetical protein